jgi:TolB-like protein/Tfp pilus assembly protein PilF
MSQGNEVHGFGPFTLDLSAGVLRRGREIVPLPPKAFDILSLLVRNHGGVVAKEKILRAVWPDTFVEEGSLSQNVFHLRKILGEEYIQTVPRRGYRFAAPAAITSLAVLPFVNLSADVGLEYFSDGLTDEIISTLAAVEGLHVPGRSSTFQFKGRPRDIREVGRLLSVAAVLEGSVRGDGERLKITAQLSAVADGYCIWSETYVRKFDNVLRLEHEIAQAILLSLRLHAPLAERQTTNAPAYHLYLKGRHFWNMRPEGVDRAMGFFENAIREDPRYALAYAGLADCYSTQSAWESGVRPPRAGFPKARKLASRAIDLDDRLAEAHTTLGYVNLHFSWDHTAAERDFQRAIALNSGYSVAHHWYSHLLTAAHRTAESLSESRRALDLDPLDLITNAHLAWHHYYAGEIPEMEASVAALRELYPEAHWSEFFLGWLRERQGRVQDAAAAFERAVTAAKGMLVMRTVAIRAAALAGRREEARAELGSLKEIARERYVAAYEIALIHAALEESDETFDYLDRAYEERSAWLVYLAVEPRLNSLRADPRFGSLLRRVRGA